MKPGPFSGLADSCSETKKKAKSEAGTLFPGIHPATSFHNDPFSDSFLFDGSDEISLSDSCLTEEFDAAVSCFLPAHYEKGYAYPLLIWLHPSGSNPEQLDLVMPEISDRNFIGVAIAGNERLPALGQFVDSFVWLQDPAAIEYTANRIRRIRQAMSRRYNINPERVFIAGQGCGGTMAYRIAFEHPEWFAGVGSLNGSLPANLNPLSNWRSCRELPVFWAHGRSSADFPESNLCHQLKLLHVAGFDVTLRQYPGGDSLPNQVYGDLHRWMMTEISRQGANIIE